MNPHAQLADDLHSLLDVTDTPSLVLADGWTLRYANTGALHLLRLDARVAGSDARALSPGELLGPLLTAAGRVVEQGSAEDALAGGQGELHARVLPLPIGIVVPAGARPGERPSIVGWAPRTPGGSASSLRPDRPTVPRTTEVGRAAPTVVGPCGRGGT